MNWLTRTAAACTVVGTVFAGTATAAHADDIKLSFGYGSVFYDDSVDVFTVCDTRADGEGVTASLWYTPNSGTSYHQLWAEQDGGDSGCDNHPYDVGKTGLYFMKICWNLSVNPPICKKSSAFNENN
ncbi:hypothetical protein J4573_33375 [Actinomadura barringtoniae]|uniref:Secreted protein n=1 Tax=Actinomadura barringtoniae TaxID=1427535 RepID=A0A939T7H7_9ACTN|nr:hypothetical protein [Actinomadura barringtoniae]MBO2452019.1 hypothetical protein [Actinomadura barringtoniae]